MTEGRKYEASITLKQHGKNGKIVEDISFLPAHNEDLPVSHEAMSQIVAVWLQVRSTLDNTDSEEGEVYTTRFVLSQDDLDSPIFSKLTMEPRISVNDPTFPSAYEACSYLATTWLIMAGVIDEQGNLLDDDSLDNTELKVSSATVH